MLSEITERMLESIPMEELKQQEEQWRDTRVFLQQKNRPGRWSQADTDACARRGCHSFQRPHSPHPAQCLMQNRHLVYVCPLYENWKRWFSCSYDKEEPPRHWRGRQRALATLYDKKGNKTPHQPPKANKNCGRNKRRGLLGQYHFTPPCAQYVVF